jgi:dTDP-4-amino-4,6-dideoxygalactose transaminase
MKIPMLDLKKQYQTIKEKIEPRVLACMAGGNYIMGESVATLEKEMASYLGVKHAVAVGSGTDALVISLRAIGVVRCDEVITTPFTFFATAEAIAAVGATPVFADVLEDTYNLDPDSVRKKITGSTKAILPVHIFGQPADMDGIMAVACEYGLKVIEDACQAVGSSYRGKMTGGIGEMGCFSFFPTKNLGAFGDGGLITTDDDDADIICRALREHCGGKNGASARLILDGGEALPAEPEDDPMYNPYKYYNYSIGYNSRLDALQAVILHEKLRYLDKWNAMRTKNAEFYIKELADADVILPKVSVGVTPVWHQFALRTKFKHEMGSYLSKKGIATGVFYPVPLHLQRAFDFLGYKEGDLPVAEMLAKETLCLPVFPELTAEELEYIVEAVISFKG